jgi:alkylhydroperoxidase family enzyme
MESTEEPPMTFIEPVPESGAPDAVAAMYATDRDSFGHLPNFARAFSHRPEAYAAWRQLNGAIKASMDLRRYELATLAAARRLRSSYCMLAHGSVLAERFMAPEEVAALAAGDASAGGLDEVDVAVMELADKVARDATSVTQADVDLVAAAAARCFFSTALDALGAQADARYAQTLDPALRDALTVGRPIAEA